MYIPWKHSLLYKVNFIMTKGEQKEVALIDSGATENFLDQHMIKRLSLGTQKVPKSQRIYNVDGTEN